MAAHSELVGTELAKAMNVKLEMIRRSVTEIEVKNEKRVQFNTFKENNTVEQIKKVENMSSRGLDSLAAVWKHKNIFLKK